MLHGKQIFGDVPEVSFSLGLSMFVISPWSFGNLLAMFVAFGVHDSPNTMRTKLISAFSVISDS